MSWSDLRQGSGVKELNGSIYRTGTSSDSTGRVLLAVPDVVLAVLVAVVVVLGLALINSLEKGNRMWGKDNTSSLMVHRVGLVQSGAPGLHHNWHARTNRTRKRPHSICPTLHLSLTSMLVNSHRWSGRGISQVGDVLVSSSVSQTYSVTQLYSVADGQCCCSGCGY